MDIAKKVFYAKTHIDSIAEHFDALEVEIKAALAELGAYASAKVKASGADRARHEADRKAQADALEVDRVRKLEEAKALAALQAAAAAPDASE